MKNNKEYYKQLELFQNIEDYQSEFETARKVKSCIQNAYSTIKFDKEIDGTDNIAHQYYILNFKVRVTQLSNKPEPNSPKLFMRKYTPILEIYDSLAIGKLIYKESFIEKTIPKWINEIYVGSIISQELFYELSKQYILLETIVKYFDSDYSIDKVNKQLTGKEGDIQLNSGANLIVNICSKLFSRIKVNPTNPYITSAINKINNLSNKLLSQKTTIILSEYLNYRFEFDLISDIDKNSSINRKENIGTFYQNDFLLLNNMEFLSDKPYTQDWNPYIIFPTKFLNIVGNNAKNIDYNKIQQILFIYQKVKLDGLFFRNEFYIPDKFNLKDYFWDMIIISRELLKNNEFSSNEK